MKVGLNSLVMNVGDVDADGDVIADELDLALRAEALGFDSLWAVEHHFSGYSMQANPLMWLAYLAARTEKIQLGSAVVVLPWHNPSRLLGEITMLDHLCRGRYVVGFGRGLGRLEFEGLGESMEDSRTKFYESAEMLIAAMESGTARYEGEVVKQPPRQVRPHPRGPIADRVYAAAVSPESAAAAARLGAGILINPQKPWPKIAEDMAAYRDVYREHHGGEAPRPIASCQVFCDEDGGRAEAVARREIGKYYASVLAHYEMTGDHFDSTRGYEYYARLAEQMKQLEESDVVDRYLKLQVFGDPEQCIAQIEKIAEVTGSDHFIGLFRYSDIGYEDARRSMEVFASDVIPAVSELAPVAV